MIGVDTNVLLRLVVIENEEQNAKVQSFFAERNADDPAYVSAIVLAETIWLLRSRYGYSRSAVADMLRAMLSSDDFLVEHEGRLALLLEQNPAPPAEIADFLIAWSAGAAGCTHTVTFDRRAASRIPGMELLS